MPSSVVKFLKQFDVFGEAVGVNYKGDQTYKTVLGSLCSLTLKVFMLLYASYELLHLLQYKHP